MRARWLFFSKPYSAVLLAFCMLAGFPINNYSQSTAVSSQASKSRVGTIVAQGRLQPSNGILKLSVQPGDRIEKILVQSGSEVMQATPLVVVESARIKKLELDQARLRLADAMAVYHTNIRQAQLSVDAADLKLRSAEQMEKQSQANLDLVREQSKILASLEDQVQRLEAIRNNPRLRGAVGFLELEAKRNQRIDAQAQYERSYLIASQAVQTAVDLRVQAESALEIAKESKADLEANPSYRPLEKQIELLQLQLELATLSAPISGTILQVSAIAGERASNLPILELADLSQMSCVAEVHESDVGLVRIGQNAEMKSASLPRTLRGKVSRIDRVVGAPQIRSPNPLARSDFRSIAVWIQVDPEDASIAAQRVQLQVEVSIDP